MMRCKCSVLHIDWGLAFLALNRYTTKPWRASWRQDHPWLAKGQKSDLPRVLSLARVIFHIWKGVAYARNVLFHVFLVCLFMICNASLLPTVVLHSARRHDASMRSSLGMLTYCPPRPHLEVYLRDTSAEAPVHDVSWSTPGSASPRHSSLGTCTYCPLGPHLRVYLRDTSTEARVHTALLVHTSECISETHLLRHVYIMPSWSTPQSVSPRHIY